MFSKIVLVCLLAAAVLADQQDQQQQQLDNGEKQDNTIVRRTVNKNIVDYTEKVQQNQPFWQQYRPVIDFTRGGEGIQKTVRLPYNPYFQGIKVNVKPYPGGYVAIRTNGAEIIKPLTSTPDSTEQEQEIIIESQTPEDQQLQQQQLYQDYLKYKRSTPYGIYPQQSGDYLARYPIWSRFLQQYQPQYEQYYQQQEQTPLYPYYREQSYRPYGQYEQDIYGQEQQGEYDRVVRDASSKKDKKIKGDKQQEQQEKLFEQQQQLQQGLYNPYRVPLYSQQYQRVPYQFYGKNYYDQQQQLPYYYQQQGPYGNQLLNRLMGYPFYQQQQQQYQPYNLPVYTI